MDDMLTKSQDVVGMMSQKGHLSSSKHSWELRDKVSDIGFRYPAV